MVWYFSLLKKGPKSHFEPIYFALLVFFTYHPVDARNIKKMKIDELGINGAISWTHRIQNIRKNSNLYPHQSRITFYTLPWDTL